MLTDVLIRKLVSPTKDTRHWDGRGLYLLAKAAGGL